MVVQCPCGGLERFLGELPAMSICIRCSKPTIERGHILGRIVAGGSGDDWSSDAPFGWPPPVKPTVPTVRYLCRGCGDYFDAPALTDISPCCDTLRPVRR